jgi:hypothetical protein
MYETDKDKKGALSLNTKVPNQVMQLENPVSDQYVHKLDVVKSSVISFDQNDTSSQNSSIAPPNYISEQPNNSSNILSTKISNEMESSSAGIIVNQQQQQAQLDSGMSHGISTNMDSCAHMNLDMNNVNVIPTNQNLQMTDPLTNIQSYNQHQERQSSTAIPMKGSDSLGPSMGVYTPDSVTNSVHSLHGNNSNSSTGVLLTAYGTPQSSTACSGDLSINSNTVNVAAGVNTIMESPNSISSVPEIPNATGSAGTTPQHSVSMAVSANSIATSYTDQQQMQTMPSNAVCNTMQQQQHNMQHHPQHASPLMPVQSPIGVHAPQSIPSQSPHSQHNMTSPHHPIPSPHPSMTSPAHSLQQGQQAGLPPINTTLTSPMGHHPH